jgi:Ca-activated chloride channel family protein
VVEWASTGQHIQRLPWTLLESPDTALAAAAEIRTFRRSFARGVTSISGIIDFARGLFPANEFDGTRLVLDISSDGRHNHGAPVGPARASALLDGVTINALAITNEYADLDVYFREQVIGGTDTFAEKANGYADYPRAIRAKLLRELANVPTS